MNNIFIRIICIAFCTTFFNKVIAQNAQADSLRDIGNLDAAIIAYRNGFYQNPNNQENTYNLACALALTYYPIDSAFHYLNKALKTDNTLWVLTDSDFISLLNDARWNNIESEQIKKYEQNNGPFKNPEYVRQLLRMIMRDQSMDYQIDQAKAYFMKNGYAPQWYYPLSEMKKNIGKDNYQIMIDLIDKYGWPKYSTVGKIAADAPLLVINHQEGEEIRKKFLPLIKEACVQGEGSCIEFAKIHDRVLVNTGQLQTYGMQFQYNDEKQLVPFPIKDPEFVDQRRSEIGLEPLKDYLKRKIDYDWNIKQKMQ